MSTQLNIKTVLFQVFQSRINTQFSSIRPTDRSLSGATTSSQSGPGSDDNEALVCIPESSSITGTSPSDCLMTYPGYSLGGGSYPSAEVQSVYSTAPANCTREELEYEKEILRKRKESSEELCIYPNLESRARCDTRSVF